MRRIWAVSTQYLIEARSGARLTVYEQNVERADHGPNLGDRATPSGCPGHPITRFVVVAADTTTRAPNCRSPTGARLRRP